MYTLQQADKNRIIHELPDNLNKTFICTGVVGAGTIVTFDGANVGQVKAAAATDFPLGFVTVGNKEAETKVTVSLNARAIVRAEVGENVALGEFIKAHSTDANGYTKFGEADTAGDYALGMALETLTTGNSGEFILFNQPFVIPA
jgi:hypothetical protein